MFGLYRLLSHLALPVVLAQLATRCVRDSAYRPRISERFGFGREQSDQSTIWIHAVSAGEVIAISPIVETLSEQYTDLRFLLTATTPSGSEEVKRRFGDRVSHVYAPYDLRGCVQRFLKNQNPKLLILVETELWPNLIDLVHRANIPIYVVNARLSEKSASGYQRIRGLTSNMLQKITHIACQYEDTADRFKALGATENQLSVTGSVKFDIKLPDQLEQETENLQDQWCFGRPTWIAASTHAPEEQIALLAHQRIQAEINDAFLILVPRHPPRQHEVEEVCNALGFAHSTISKSPTRVPVLIVDRMGILLQVLGMGSAVLIGGSFQGTGGHNPIEPAICGIPMIMGRDRHNFAEICSRFEEVNALKIVNDVEDIAQAVISLLTNKQAATEMANAAYKVVELNRGAKNQVLNLMHSWITQAIDQSDSKSG